MKILHLYHDLMNLYGEYANVSALERKLQEKGADVSIDRLSIGDEISAGDYDFIYIGSGTELNQKAALEDIRRLSADIRTALEKGAVVLATGNAFELFGRSITDYQGKQYDGLGFFDFTVTEIDKRTVEDVKCTCSLVDGDVIGFINKASEIEGITEPFFAVAKECGNCRGECTEGIVSGSFYGTHIIGPLLIRNPQICEYFAQLILGRE